MSTTTVPLDAPDAPVADAAVRESSHPGDPLARVCVHGAGTTWRFDRYPRGLVPTRRVSAVASEAIDADDVPAWLDGVLAEAGYELAATC